MGQHRGQVAFIKSQCQPLQQHWIPKGCAPTTISIPSLPAPKAPCFRSSARPLRPPGACQSLARDADGPKTPCKPGALQGEPRDGYSGEIEQLSRVFVIRDLDWSCGNLSHHVTYAYLNLFILEKV